MEQESQTYLMLGELREFRNAALSKLDAIDRRLDNHGVRLKRLEEKDARRSGFVNAGRVGWIIVAALVAFAKDIGHLIGFWH